jgi:hypothetical protein
MCASPVRYGRIAMFDGEDLGRWLLGDCRKTLTPISRELLVMLCEILSSPNIQPPVERA